MTDKEPPQQQDEPKSFDEMIYDLCRQLVEQSQFEVFTARTLTDTPMPAVLIEHPPSKTHVEESALPTQRQNYCVAVIKTLLSIRAKDSPAE